MTGGSDLINAASGGFATPQAKKAVLLFAFGSVSGERAVCVMLSSRAFHSVTPRTTEEPALSWRTLGGLCPPHPHPPAAKVKAEVAPVHAPLAGALDRTPDTPAPAAGAP